jgi:hypothetical protein
MDLTMSCAANAPTTARPPRIPTVANAVPTPMLTIAADNGPEAAKAINAPPIVIRGWGVCLLNIKIKNSQFLLIFS